MKASVVHITPLTFIERERKLPIPGRVTVRKGQKVAPRDVVAEAKLLPEHMLLDVARGLGVPVKQADKLIQRSPGETVAEGDLIAGPVGLARRVVRAPATGKVVVAGEGQVLLEIESMPFELKAGIAGTISQLIPDRGAVIETQGAVIQGIWGNGQLDFGLLQTKLEKPDDVLTADQIDVSLRGSIVLGGILKDSNVLHKAADIPLRGLIVGSISAALLPLAIKMQYPILVLDAFGQVAMNPLSYKLLISNDNREVSVNAEPMDRFTGARPEAIIPLPAEGSLPKATDNLDFEAGQRVVLTRKPHQSSVGTIQYIFESPTVVASGIKAMAADVKLEDGEVVRIPLNNLEVVA